MKKKKHELVHINKIYSLSLFGELQEAERDFVMSIEEHWDALNKKSELQKTVLRSGNRIKMARKILQMLGDTPRVIH